MKKILMGLLLLLAAAPALAEDFNVEDALVKPPPAVQRVLQGLDVTREFHCAFEGRAVDLDSDGRATDFIATTSQGCAWGAAAGPIEVLRCEAERCKLVLDGTGYSLTLGRPQPGSLRNVAISSGTANLYQEELWKYDGQQYKKARSYMGARR
ncbi:hypothetical protein D0B54_23395 [Solimonas sp. K1W22B-7]|uniref:hypothetical protein n=1 Tax=Solimonas sp. K1W22B-7 TaxID=2303331 RepID=UPI000E331000|nr:hypothetical protein [Solimonas sp. K1W22B-7]AXQ31447.1 hypothetical protein D0B54_23395 [Solimonas sp. K1W22B-7]